MFREGNVCINFNELPHESAHYNETNLMVICGMKYYSIFTLFYALPVFPAVVLLDDFHVCRSKTIIDYLPFVVPALSFLSAGSALIF